MCIAEWGAICFGVVIGWVTYRTLIRRKGGAALSDIATVIGAVGGGAVMGIFNSSRLFAFYSFGLAAGFFAYFIVFLLINDRATVADQMGGDKMTKIDP
jgi:zinc transporter ZupT